MLMVQRIARLAPRFYRLPLMRTPIVMGVAGVAAGVGAFIGTCAPRGAVDASVTSFGIWTGIRPQY